MQHQKRGQDKHQPQRAEVGCQLPGTSVEGVSILKTEENVWVLLEYSHHTRNSSGEVWKGQTSCVSSWILGLSRRPTRSPVRGGLSDSTWKGKAVGKRDNSSNRSLNWDFLVYKWKPGTAPNVSQASRLRKAVALTQPLWSETNKLYNDTGGIVNVVLLLGNA